MQMGKYQRARNRRAEAVRPSGMFKGGVLAPTGCTALLQSESAMVRHTLAVELDRIMGRMLTRMYIDVKVIYVPALAIERLKYPEATGYEEAFRDKLVSGEEVFGLEAPNEISDRMDIEPRAIDGQLRVSEAPRLSYIAAVNWLRQKRKIDATLLDANHTGLAPALLSETILDRFRGALDPDPNVDGAVDLTGTIPVDGLGIYSAVAPDVNLQTNHATGTLTEPGYHVRGQNEPPVGTSTRLVVSTQEGGLNPNLRAVFGGEQSLSLRQFLQAERQDQLTREMARIVQEYPEHGEQLVTRWVHGLSVEANHLPWEVYSARVPLGRSLRNGMDGAGLDVRQTDHGVEIDFARVIPKTEFGGFIVPLVSLQPEEVIPAQPHPILSKSWRGRNFAADELAIAPEPVEMRELHSGVAQADENTRAFWTGRNELYRLYTRSGFNRHVDPTEVANQNAIWTTDIPMSVTADNINYPVLEHTPFQVTDPDREVAFYTHSQVTDVATPIIYGPTPVERIDAIEDNNLFDDDEE